MLCFATISDYNARASEPVETDEEKRIVQAKLEDASAKIAAELANSGISLHAYLRSDIYRRILCSVTCAMVDRAMMAALPGLKSRQQTAGPYSFTDSFANPTGDLYLLSSERRSLGIGGARIMSVPFKRHGPRHVPPRTYHKERRDPPCADGG
jgi:hypothetical protein